MVSKSGRLSFMVLATLVELLFHTLDYFLSLLFFVACRNLAKYFLNMIPAFAKALGTSSSHATLLVSVSCAEERNDVSTHIAHFACSLGVQIPALAALSC